MPIKAVRCVLVPLPRAHCAPPCRSAASAPNSPTKRGTFLKPVRLGAGLLPCPTVPTTMELHGRDDRSLLHDSPTPSSRT